MLTYYFTFVTSSTFIGQYSCNGVNLSKILVGIPKFLGGNVVKELINAWAFLVYFGGLKNADFD